ncbi:MAG: UDP-N-acetylmuramoyl-L-alanine--D-glutamate ligase [Pseudomonadota bacterium]
MIPLRAYAGTTVGVLGLGRSGLSAARALKAGGATVLCWDDQDEPRADAYAEGLALADLSRPREAASISLLVVSPGIVHHYPIPHPAVSAAWEAGVPVDNDVSLFFQAMADPEREGADDGMPKILCITGSNGKSTTTALTHHLLSEAGRHTQMGGNIGRGVLDLDNPGPGEVVVLELSSYQTELARALAPDIAVFLNLSPDHLSRHGGMGGYFCAKKRLFEMGGPERAIIGVDGLEGRFLANTLGPETIQISNTRRLKGEGWSVYMNKNHLTEWRGGKQMAAIDLRACPGLIGAHNHQNACAAYAAARAVGVAPRRLEAGLASFPGLAHRMERLGTAGGIAFVNDSKATNADAAEKALLSFERIRWIAGGQAKEGGIDALAPLFPRIARAYLIGESAEAFAATLGDKAQISQTLDRAVAEARADAQSGETILLAPAAASWDQFASFEDRGDRFRALVAPFLEDAT